MPILQDGVIGLVLLQRKCDGGWGDVSEEDKAGYVARRLAGEPLVFNGCGVVFQWWWGACCCPSCGKTYAITLENIDRYRIESPSLRLDDLLRMQNLVQSALLDYRAENLPSKETDQQPKDTIGSSPLDP